MSLSIISVFWVWYDHSIRGNLKLITNFLLSLAQVNWNFADRFLDVQPGALQQQADSLQWFAAADNKLLIHFKI